MFWAGRIIKLIDAFETITISDYPYRKTFRAHVFFGKLRNSLTGRSDPPMLTPSFDE